MISGELSSHPEYEPSQTELEEIFSGIESSLKDPVQKRHVDVTTFGPGNKVFREIMLDEEESRLVFDDAKSGSQISVRLAEPIVDEPFWPRTILIEFIVKPQEVVSENHLREISVYYFEKSKKRDENDPDGDSYVDLYNLSKTSKDIVDISKEVTVYDVGEAPDEEPTPEKTDEEIEIDLKVHKTMTEITSSDTEFLKRLVSVLQQ